MFICSKVQELASFKGESKRLSNKTMQASVNKCHKILVLLIMKWQMQRNQRAKKMIWMLIEEKNETIIEKQRSLTLRTRFPHNKHQLADHEENQID